MQGLVTAVYAGCLMAIFFLTACSSSFTACSGYMSDGQRYWKLKEYEQARKAFLMAYEAEKGVVPLVWAASASYWLNDLTSAETYIRQAEPKAKTSVSYFRMAGYKALVLLRQGKKDEGLGVLNEYVQAYGKIYPSSNLPWIDLMIKKGDADIEKLEAMLEDDISGYEQAIEQFESTGTGYFDKRGS
jgi:tetratricopeptide (TPR) repeat protein